MAALYNVEKIEAPEAQASALVDGWVKVTDSETGDEAIGAVYDRKTGFIRIPADITKSMYGFDIDASECKETVAAVKALFS